MGRLFGIVAIVLGVWLALQLYTEGAENTFGGAAAFLEGSDAGAEDAGERPSLPRRAGVRVERAHEEAAARRARVLPD